ncbi:DNA-directed DNA polymerase [Sporobolomyces salmoneus]|uniref:DNA-directed DNA polymerase n=1 Tax=Sporobolomyces salmoneus TaxID=183962 RepID=UPI00317684E2
MVAPTSNSASERKQSILPLFPLLASHDQTTRLDASYNLLNSLPLPTPPPNDADTPYALKRLLAGLASSNESARQGFAVALTQLLATLPDEQASKVLPQFEESTTSRTGIDAREERDLLFAKLVGSHALIRSGILVRPTGSTSNGGESWKEVVQGLVTLGNKKSWIREPSYWVICQAIESLVQAEESEWKEETIKWTVQRLVNDAREKAKGWSPEKIAVVLTLQAHGVDTDFKSILSPTFPSGSLLSRSSLPSLGQALRGALQSGSNPFEASGSSSKTPRQGSNAVKTSKNGAAPAPGQNPHFAWNLILESYFPRDGQAGSSTEDRASWADFWKVCVDDSLFGSPSLPLKALGFSLVQSTLPLLPPSQVTTLFGPSTLRVFANHLRKSSSHGNDEKTLSRVAEKLAHNLLPTYLTSHPEATLPLLKALTLPPNSHPGAFENKFLEKLVAKLPLNGVKGWVNYLQHTLFLSPPEALISAPTTVTKTTADEEEDVEMQEEEDAKSLEASKEKRILAVRTWSLDQLLHVARNGGVVKDEEVLRNLVEFLAVVGWFDVKKELDSGARSYVADPQLSTAQRQAAESRFFSVLTALLTASTSTTAADKTAQSGSVWLSRAFATLENLKKDAKHFSIAAESTANEDDEDDEEELEDLKKRSREMYELLGKAVGKKEKAKEEEEQRRKHARSLIEGVLLVEWEEKGEAYEVLEQLCDVLPLLFSTLLAAYKSEEDPSMEDDDSEAELPEPTTVLISLLLSLLQRSSAFVKAVASEVIEGFAGEMGEQAVGLLLETIAPVPEETELEAEGEDAEGSEAVSGNKKGKETANAEDSEEEGSDDDEDSDDEEVDEKFREELLKALEAGGLAPLNDHDGDDDDDEEESEEELLDDEAMMELDDKLADIFRANGGGRKSKKRDRTDDLHYRLRLLDLLEVLARKRPSSPLLVPTFVPLLNLARSTSPLEIELRNKASKLVRYLVQPRKSADSISPPSPDSALEALEELHALAQGVEISEFAPIIAQTSIALVKAALASPSADASTSTAVSTLFANSFEQYLGTKNARTKVQPLLTNEFCKRAPAAAWGMFDRIVSLAKGEVEGDKKATVNAFRRMQAFEAAQNLLVSYTNLKTPESTAAVLAGVPAYQSALHDALSTSLTSAPSAATFDAARLKQLVKNALSAARMTVQLSSQAQAAKAWSVSEWISLLDAAKSNERFKGAVAVQTLIKQLVSVLGGSIVEEGGKKEKKKDKKRKATEDVASSESKGKKAKPEVEEEETGMNEVEVEVEMDEEEVAPAGGKGTPSKKEKKDKKKRRRSEGKA